MAVYGYARCSTNESKQDIDRQIRELKEHGAEIIYQEFEHGDSPSKTQQEALFAAVQQGDTIITLEVSRLSRSTKQLCEIIERVKEKSICLDVVGSITIDCRTGNLDPMTEAFLKMAGVFAELEAKMIRERVRSGMEHARAKGKQIGRPVISAEDVPQSFTKYYRQWKQGNIKKVELAKLSGLSRPTVNRYIELMEE